MSDGLESEELKLAHRQSGVMLGFMLGLLALVVLAQLNMYIGSTALFFVLLPLPFCIIAIRAYLDRQAWALPWVVALWVIVIAICFVMMIIEFTAASSGSTDLWGYAQGLLLLFLCWSMSQRLRLLRHPLFRAWYSGQALADNQNIELLPDEVLASCPHCLSLLAIQPMALKSDERCPMCSEPLVSVESVAQYGEEE